MKRRWLQDWPWETVVTINAGLRFDYLHSSYPAFDVAPRIGSTLRLRLLRHVV
jgi:hypothetical protein